MNPPPSATPIAIVGMGCRFAGAADLHEYWTLCLEGTNAFGPVPADRWDNATFFDPSPRATDKSYAPTGGFIADVQTFPAMVFGLPPRRVEVMDPQQRLGLECALQAIEDAGLRGRMPHRTGVYLGVTAQEWRNILNSRLIAAMMSTGAFGQAPDDPAALLDAVDRIVPSRPFTAIGVLGNMMAASIAQELDLHGPAYTTDAACASAMIAIENAVAHLRNGSIDAALAGGVYLCLTPDNHVAFSRIGAISRSGFCRPFDHRADGFVQGDGAGLLLLKRLDDARRDGDRVYAVIHGIRTNNDGRGEGPMAPRVEGQCEAITAAWAESGQAAEELGYVETHGTGTDVGDVYELKGLQTALGGRPRHAALGSSKANVGHTMSAAAVAGFIRSALAIHHGTIPPMGGFEHPREDLPIDGSGFYIPTAPARWPEGPRLAGISSFGFGGTNGHAVIGAPDAAPATAPEPAEQAELILLSAADEPSLRALAGRIARAIEADPRLHPASVARACAGRVACASRLALVASTRAQLIERLDLVAQGKKAPHAVIEQAGEAPRIAFLYPGQGSQRTGMLRDLRRRFPRLARSLARLEDALAQDLPLPLSHLLYPELRTTPVPLEQAETELTSTEVCQPVLLAVGAALTELLASVGLHPHVVVGHSLGEFTAAAAAGVLSAEEAARFVARRGRAMTALPGDHGAMAAVMAPREQVEPLLVDGAIIANVNHPRQLVVSGLTPAVEQVIENAQKAELTVRRLHVSHGFHSPALADLDPDGLLDGMDLRAPTVTVASGIADRPYRDADDAREVFRRHAISPVEFVRALGQCQEAGADLFLQVGAGGPLAAFARGGLAPGHRGVISLASTDDDDGGVSLLEALGRLWALGAPLRIDEITAPAPVASLPAGVLPRERYWPVKDEPQLAMKLPGLAERGPAARPARIDPSTSPPAPAPASATEAPDLDLQVRQVIAKVSAWPVAALKPAMGLIDELGFDSLMVNDLVAGLKDTFPAVQGIPQELLVNRPTVQDIIDYVASVERSGGSAVDDDAPLSAWVPVWRHCPHPNLPRRSLASGLRVLQVGPGVEGLLPRLPGAALTRLRPDEVGSAGPVDLILWDARAGQGEAAPLIAALDRQASLGRSPDLVVLREERAHDEGLSGLCRAVAAEWPQARVKSLVVAGAIDAAAVHSELTSADISVDVRLDGHNRQVAGLDRLPADPGRTVTEADTVVISGGTAGIGAALAADLAPTGCRLVLVGRSEPRGAAAELCASGRATWVRADVLDRTGLSQALRPLLGEGPVLLVHSAGLLADGPLGGVDPAAGQRALAVKLDGWTNLREAIGPRLAAGVAIGSWAGRFGNRHQAWYAAANAALAGLVAGTDAPCLTLEFSPWTDSEMVASIPSAVQGAMRAEGVDFVGTRAGLDAIRQALGGRGVRVLGRDLPSTTRAVRWTETLSVETHPFLADHAIEGTPVLPMASAADLLALTALPPGAPLPFELLDLRLYQGVAVREPLLIELSARGEKATLRQGERRALAWTARIRPCAEAPTLPPPTQGGEAPSVSLREFYGGLTFHGPLLQGITAVEGLGPDFVRGRVHTGSPERWQPDTNRGHFTVDPLALDSAMQLSALVAWIRYRRAGTPMGITRLVQLAPLPDGELTAEVWTGEAEGDRFTGTVVLRDDSGRALLLAEGVAAELRVVQEEGGFIAAPRQVDFDQWPEIESLDQRLQAAAFIGIKNPFFRVHEGTARNTSVVEGRELVNYSSYNYIGLSGDPRVLADVGEAIARYGTSVSASRVASGERPFHGELEALLARCQDTDDAVLFTAGHATNVTTIGHLLGKDDLVLHDELIHDSALQGIKLAGCTRRSFRHDDPGDLDRQLRMLRRNFDRCLIVVEGVYSMDGDICDLPAYVALKKRHGCLLMVDEAHSFGIVGATGCGVREHFGIPGREIDIWMGTLSKSLSSCGGWIAGRSSLIRYLKYTAPGFVYSAGLTPANGVAALSSLKLMLAEPERVRTLQDNAAFFHARLNELGLDTGPALGASGVIPVITGNSVHALWLSQRLNERGVNVQPIVYPAVADNAARLRFFLSSTHTRAQLDWTARNVREALDEVRRDFPL